MKLYIEQFKAALLYGDDSSQYKEFEKNTKEFSRGFTLDKRLAQPSILATAALRAVEELKRDPSNIPLMKATAAKNIVARKQDHDKELVTYNKNRYRTNVSRVFTKDGQTIKVYAFFDVDIDEKKETAYIYHQTSSTTNENIEVKWVSGKLKTVIMSSKRVELLTYLKNNLVLLFGEGAGEKSIDNFFKWYDSRHEYSREVECQEL